MYDELTAGDIKKMEEEIEYGNWWCALRRWRM